MLINIASIRCRQGIPQVDLAKAIGVTGSAVSQYESGKRKPNIEILKKIAQVFDCTIDDLIKEGK